MDIFRKPESRGPADDSFICCPSLIAFDVESKPENREVLSRSSLLLDLVAKGVMNCVTQEVKDLYHILEHEFLPIHLALQVQLLLTKISKLGGRLATASSVPEVQLSQYVPSLEKLAALRLLQRVSQVYQTMTIDNLSKLIPFFDFPVVEKISVDAVKNNFLAMKVDYRKGAIFFGNKDIFRKAILHPGPPQDFALLTVQQVIKPQKQVKLVEDENMLLENFLRTLLQELSAAVDSGEAIMQYGQSIVDEDARPGQIPRLLDIVLYLCEKEHVEGGMIFQLLEDLTEMSTMRNCKDVFGYIESKQDILGKPELCARGKLVMLRICNELLRRLLKANDVVFCGRFIMFLAHFFPLSERSAVNIKGVFNTSNETKYEKEAPESPYYIANICDSLGHCLDALHAGRGSIDSMKCSEFTSLLVESALRLARDNDKVKANAVRGLGNLARSIQFTKQLPVHGDPLDSMNSKLEYPDTQGSKAHMKERSHLFRTSSGGSDWLEQMVQATGNVKVQWNVCHALSNLFLNKSLKLQDMD